MRHSETPDHFLVQNAMLKSVLVGLILSMITIAIHALGTTWWLQRLRQSANANEELSVISFANQLRILCSTAVVLLSLHIAEVVVWGLTYLMLGDGQALSTFEESIYFSTVTFASLGYGDVVIDNHWRLLSAIQAMTGLLVFGWSSALLFSVVQRIWQASHEQDQSTRDK